MKSQQLIKISNIFLLIFLVFGGTKLLAQQTSTLYHPKFVFDKYRAEYCPDNSHNKCKEWKKFEEVFPESASSDSSTKILTGFSNFLRPLRFNENDYSGLSCLNLTRFNLYKLTIRKNALSQLKFLDISNNKLERLKGVKNLNRLEALVLTKCQLRRFPALSKTNENLGNLFLNENNIKRIPKSISNIPSLQNLFLSENRIKKIPDWISTLPSVELLWLSKNPITEIPTTLFRLPSLRNLNLKSTLIKTIDASLLASSGITKLNIASNELENPDELLKEILESEGTLRELNISNCGIKSIEADNIIQAKLEYLNLSDNQLTRFPMRVLRNTSLKQVILDGNPISIESLSRLEKKFPHIQFYYPHSSFEWKLKQFNKKK